MPIGAKAGASRSRTKVSSSTLRRRPRPRSSHRPPAKHVHLPQLAERIVFEPFAQAIGVDTIEGRGTVRAADDHHVIGASSLTRSTDCVDAISWRAALAWRISAASTPIA